MSPAGPPLAQVGRTVSSSDREGWAPCCDEGITLTVVVAGECTPLFPPPSVYVLLSFIN